MVTSVGLLVHVRTTDFVSSCWPMNFGRNFQKIHHVRVPVGLGYDHGGDASRFPLVFKQVLLEIARVVVRARKKKEKC